MPTTNLGHPFAEYVPNPDGKKLSRIIAGVSQPCRFCPEVSGKDGAGLVIWSLSDESP